MDIKKKGQNIYTQYCFHFIGCISTPHGDLFEVKKNIDDEEKLHLGYFTDIDQAREWIDDREGKSFELKNLQSLDITGAEVVQIQVKADGSVVWVNTEMHCVLRICQVKSVEILDERLTAPKEPKTLFGGRPDEK